MAVASGPAEADALALHQEAVARHHDRKVIAFVPATGFLRADRLHRTIKQFGEQVDDLGNSLSLGGRLHILTKITILNNLST